MRADDAGTSKEARQGRGGRAKIIVVALTLVLAGTAACGDDTQGAGDIAFPVSIAPVTEGIYPQFRLEPNHAGRSPPGTNLGATLSLAWQTEPFAIGNYSASKSSPAVDVDRVYVGVDDGQLIALDRRNGSVVWRFRSHRFEVELASTDSLHLGIHGSPALDDKNVYIGDYSGYLYAVDKLSGGLRWENRLGGSIGASPVLFGDFVFIAVEYPDPDGKVFMVRAETGEVLWSTPFLGHHPHSSVSIDAPRGLLFVGANNGTLFCFDFLERQLKWAYQTGAEIKSTAAVVGDTVYVTSWDTKLHEVLITSGQERLEYPTSGASMSSPSVYQDTVYFGSNDGLIYAVDTLDGHLKWAFQTGGPLMSSPTVMEDSGQLAIGSRDKHLYLLDLASGELRGSLELHSGVTSVPVAVGDSLFVNDDSGTVYSFRGAAGTP